MQFGLARSRIKELEEKIKEVQDRASTQHTEKSRD